MANLKAFRSCLALGLTMALIPQAAFAADYNPDGFHECILENVEGSVGKHAVIAVRQSCAHINGTDMGGNQKIQQRSKSSGHSISILDTIRQKNPSLRSHSDQKLKALIRNSPEFSTFSDKQFDRYVTGDYGEP